ncbi:hypothetical protein E2C01_045767 [Portunus trituberculatus]|uniref:Uncharacterized protein n=1 Tax=Portunus trituberculatus TaxID=210409 RepID=A0A5B7FW08_PORTR|nr:hypothetical protein [Portunus trituberculatus]
MSHLLLCRHYHKTFNSVFLFVDCRIPYPCSVLASWTLGNGLLKKGEIEAFAKTWCQYVWSVQRKAKNQDGEEYHLVEEEQGRTCIVEFSRRLLPSPKLVLHQVILEEQEQGVAAEGTDDERPVSVAQYRPSENLENPAISVLLPLWRFI